MKSLLLIVVIISIMGCSVQEAEQEKPLLTKERISLKNLVDEKKDTPDSTLLALHAQHHPHGVLESRSIPCPFTAPDMNSYSDHVRYIEDLVVINPGPGEYVHVMEGQRHGYLNLVLGITETFPGGAPPGKVSVIPTTRFRYPCLCPSITCTYSPGPGLITTRSSMDRT